MTMIVVNIYEAKAKLSEFLELAARGEQVVICKRNRPIAELRAMPSAREEARPIGLAAGRVTVPDSFLEPLPDDVLEGFEGPDGSSAAEDAGTHGEGARASRVAEHRPEYRAAERARTRGRKR